MNVETPVIFADGTEFFDTLAKEYAHHNRGLFILAPSGAGKSHFVNGQAQKDWIDGDTLWPLAGADMTDDGWTGSIDVVMEINNKSDVITHEAMKLGFWVIGSSNNFLKPDAIVLPKWDTHKRYITSREQHAYDGGAKTHDLEAVKAHRAWIRKWKKHGVPCFDSIESAVRYLTRP